MTTTPSVASTTELDDVPVRVVAFPPGTTMRIEIEGTDRSAELAWTRQKAHARGLRALVLTAGCPPVAESGFDVVHRVVEAAADVVAEGAGDEVGAIEVAICAVDDPEGVRDASRRRTTPSSSAASAEGT